MTGAIHGSPSSALGFSFPYVMDPSAVTVRLFSEVHIPARDMAVSARVLHQVFLVVLFRREEIPERFQLHGQLCAGLFFFRGIDGPDLRQGRFIGVIDPRPVLDPLVVPFAYPTCVETTPSN